MMRGVERRRRATDAMQDLFRIIVGINRAVIEKGASTGVLDVLLDAAVRLFEVDWCSLALVDEASGDLKFTVHTGEAHQKTFRVPKGHGFAGWVIENRKAILCNNPAEDERFFGAIDRETGLETQSLMCAPLRYKDKVLGVIQVLNTQKAEGFNEDDLGVLVSFGEFAGVALKENATLQVADHAGSIYREQAKQRYAMVWGKSAAMKSVMSMAKKAARSQATVLLMSESGTGKEVVAHAIHRWSLRNASPFVAVNCVTLTPELLSSELFGHEKGAFTGAVGRKIGKFELANKGTIFLDEIGDLSLDLQARLLRVLQEREFQRVGGSVDIQTDVRVIAATNRNLAQAVEEGRFREDLYYRLNVVSLELPLLRERSEDIPDLVNHFLEKCSSEIGRFTLTIDPRAMALLQAYAWPGNVRQLRNTIERAVVLTPGGTITVEALPPEIRGTLSNGYIKASEKRDDSSQSERISPDVSLAEAMDIFKRQRIEQALTATDGNQAKAAEKLGIKAPNLSRLMKKLHMK